MASDKAKEQLYQYHEYANKLVDSPILNPESLNYHEKL